MLGLTSFLKGQGYESIFGDSLTVWKSHYIKPPPYYYFNDSFYCFNKDSIVNGTKYKIVNSAFHNHIPNQKNSIAGFIREDTIEGKLWYRTPKDTSEKLIYDLSLTEQDSFFVHNSSIYNRYGDKPPGWQSVDSIYYDNDSNKTIIFNLKQVSCIGAPLKFIEGHGPTFGFSYKSDFPIKLCEVFICHHRLSKDKTPLINFNNYIYNFCPDTRVVPGINNDVINTNDKIKVYPNPVRDFLKIKIKNLNRFKKLKFILYSIQGQKIKSYNLSGKVSKIITQSLNRGVYLYRIYQKEQGAIKRGKLIKQ